MNVNNNTFIETDPITMMIARAAIRGMGAESVSALLLDGPPGIGKSYLGKHLANDLKAKLIHFQFFPGCGREDLLFDTGPGGNGERIPGILLQTIEASKTGKVVLLLDELDKADVRVDSFLLTFLNDAKIFLPQFGELIANTSNLLVIITKNDEREASGPLLRRCRCVFMDWPRKEVELKILQHHLPEVRVKLLDFLIQESNRFRSHADVQKKVSTSELLRMARDIMEEVKSGTHQERLGQFFINSIAPIERDRRILQHPPTYYGVKILESCV